MTRVHLTQESPGIAKIRPDGWLGDEFAKFREAIEGAKYDRVQRTNLAPIDKLPTILKRLRELGFDANIDAKIRQALQEHSAQSWNDLKSVQDRIARIDEEIHASTLKERGVGERLFPYQKVGSQWLALRHAALLADEAGTGKTRQAIVAIPAGAPTLIVGPAVAKGVWIGEMERCRPHVRTTMLVGRTSFRWPREGEMVVTNYDILPDIHDRTRCDGELPAKPCMGCKDELVFSNGGVNVQKKGHVPECTGFDKDRERCPGCHPLLKEVLPGTVMGLDEVHYAKAPASARALKVRAMSDAVRTVPGGRTWGFSGTPMENDPRDLWFVMKACGIAEECFGSWKKFVECFNGKTLDYGAVDWGLPQGEVAERIQRGSLRRMKADVLQDLPSKMWREIVVDVDKKTIAACDRYLKDVGGIERLTDLLAKDKVDFESMASVRQALATAKIPAVVELVSEYEKRREPVVVFSMHRGPIDVLAARPGWATITGDVDAKKRKEIVEKFQAGTIFGLACTIQAAGVALTLTRACHGIFVDLSYKPGQNEQAEDRLNRLSQTRGCVYTIVKANHPLDKRVVEILMKKRSLIAASVDAARVLDDVASDRNPFEDQIRLMQEEIACGRAVRRMAESPEEEQALEDLHTLRFQRSDDRIALSLAEQAFTIGLSEKQWGLARDVAGRGTRREPPAAGLQPEGEREGEPSGSRLQPDEKDAVELEARKDDGMVIIEEDPHLRDCAKAAAPSEACSCGSTPNGAKTRKSKAGRQQEMSSETKRAVRLLETATPDVRLIVLEILMGAEEDLDAFTKACAISKGMTDDDTDAVVGVFSERWCSACGDDAHKGECADEDLGDDGELDEDEEDEDADDEDGDEEEDSGS